MEVLKNVLQKKFSGSIMSYIKSGRNLRVRVFAWNHNAFTLLARNCQTLYYTTLFTAQSEKLLANQESLMYLHVCG